MPSPRRDETARGALAIPLSGLPDYRAGGFFKGPGCGAPRMMTASWLPSTRSI